MNAWTSAAKDELNRFLDTIRQPLEQAGADAAEVIDDIKRHIDEEVAASRLGVVTVTELKPMLARIGEPWRREPAGDHANAGQYLKTLKQNGALRSDSFDEPTGKTLVLDEPASPPTSRTDAPVKPEKNGKTGAAGGRPSYFHLIFGVFLPALTLGIEWFTGFCASNIFNPIPTCGHVFLVAFVPAANAAAWLALKHGQEGQHGKALSLALGTAIGISIVYSVVYIPLLLPGILALAFFGLGLLPLAPYFALTTSASLRKRVRTELEFTPAFRDLRFWPGVLAGILAFVAVDLPYIGTTAAMRLASTPTKEQTGLKLLRAFGHEQTILRACYSASRDFRNAGGVLFWVAPARQQVSLEQARRVYFQLYGRAFNSVPAPNPRSAGFGDFLESPFDPERGGDRVGSPVSGLSMLSSRIDATVEPRAALSYLEWIFEFKNVAASQSEARCEIELPPGAVVSRLTLWINGEEREAAFAGKSQVRAAYQNIVAQRRDPVLVTSSGKDRILVQCFPVPPEGGIMKVRVGMTVPLLLDEQKNGILRWPYLRERNFALEEKLEHSFWIDSPTPVRTLSLPLTTERTASGHFMARGKLPETSGGTVQPAVLIDRSGAPDRTWARDTRGEGGAKIVQQIRAAEVTPVRDIVLVIDGSISMERLRKELASIQVNAEHRMRIVVAGPAPRELDLSTGNTPKTLSEIDFMGGQDNVPALERGWDLAAANGSGAVIWLHGAQPVLLSTAEGLRQRFERRPNAVRILDVAIERAPNAIAAELPAWARYEMASMHQPPIDTVNRLVAELAGRSIRYELVRERSLEPAEGSKDSESTLHLARLWAFDEIRNLIRAHRQSEAVELAARYQLVTEVSGAVVLETAEQYQRAGLQPVSAQTVPSVPEPSTWALLILGALTLMLAKRRVRSASPARI